MNTEAIDKVWTENPELIRQYLELLPLHERLCSEVEYIVQSQLKEKQIEFSQVCSRAKTMNSVCEKLHRKSYADPFSEITDLAGIRIVYLYISDLEEIEKLIESEFDVVEKENKLEAKEDERFGYGALHYLIKIKKKHSGARYDDLRKLVCEIQVKTILQDAWSVVAHHLSYKRESDVPKSLMRKLNALSGLFETADDQFENLRIARTQYVEKTEQDISTKKRTLEQAINLDNLSAYLITKFPKRKKSRPDSISELLDELIEIGYTSLADLDRALNISVMAAEKKEKASPPASANKKYADVGIVRCALSIVDDDYCLYKYSEDYLKQNKKYKNFLKKDA